MVDLAPRALWGQPIIVGAGLAGAMAALTLSPRPVILLDRAPIGRVSSSRWAQGGLAAAVGEDDSPAIQAADTVAAGAGLADPEVAARIAAAGPAVVAALEAYGVRFDREPSGALACGLEAAHARRRILHVRDATGSAIITALADRIERTPSITRLSGVALRLLTGDGGIAGLLLRGEAGDWLLPTRAVILATGGIGGLWRSTTNPPASRGTGLLLAARAGATLQDLEFVQLHPTALAIGADPMPLISEAVRGEGAYLIDAAGNRFMADTKGGELAPRDVVARAVFRQWAGGGRAALDVRHWPQGKFADRFPNIHRVLAENGLDPARDAIPVRPAAHYHMGGVRVGPTGRTDVTGLWACGEVACTGLHGGNRLASNSLLEAAVCGRFVAEDVAGATFAESHPVSSTDADVPRPGGDAQVAAMRELMDLNVGVVRDASGLSRAIETLDRLARDAAGTEAADAIAVARMIAVAASERNESRGAHWRSDFPKPNEPARHSTSRWHGPAA